jgi:hypothetical protein
MENKMPAVEVGYGLDLEMDEMHLRVFETAEIAGSNRCGAINPRLLAARNHIRL